MKVLVVLCAVLAGCLAKPYLGYSLPTSYSYSTSVVSVNKPAAVAYAAPAAVAYAAPVAPAVVAAPAPVAYSAPVAPAVVAAPAPVAYAAPAPAVVAAPAPVAYAAPAVVAAPAPVAAKSQYHAQNELGEASYGHAEPGQTHNAVQDAHGNKVGSFSYVNPAGQVLRTDYVADAAGYRVASNALPAAPIVAPIDTPEVAAAKANFLNEYAARAVHARRRRSAVLVQTPASTVSLAARVAYAAPAPVAYAAPLAPVAAPLAPVAAPLAPVAAHLAYAAPAPVAYAGAHVAPVAYAGHVAAPLAPAVRAATLTTVVNNPGHAVSYRVD